MEQFFEKLTQVNDAVNSFVWVKIGLFLLIGAGIIMTVSTRFFQVTHTYKSMIIWRNITYMISPFNLIKRALTFSPTMSFTFLIIVWVFKMLLTNFIMT